MSEMTTKQALIAVKELIGTKEKWTQRAYARDKRGNQTDPKWGEAVCYCTSGAVRVILGKVDHMYTETYKAIRIEMEGNIPVFNDTHSFEEVHAALDRAITKA